MKTIANKAPKRISLGSARRQTQGTFGPNKEIDMIHPHP